MNITTEQLEKATVLRREIDGLEKETAGMGTKLALLTAKQQELNTLLGVPTRKRKPHTQAAKDAIAAATKARWAAKKTANPPAPTPAVAVK